MPRPRIHVSTGRGVSVLDVPHPARDRWRSGAHQQHVKVLGVRGVAVRLAQRKREKVQQRCHHQRARAVHRVLAQHVDQAGDSAHATAAVVRWGASRGGRWWGRAGRGGAGRAGRGGRSDAGRSARRFACVKQAIGRHVSYGQATPPPRTPEGDAPVLIVGTRMPAAPRSSACCIPPRSCGPSTRTSACCPPAALTAVSMAAMHA